MKGNEAMAEAAIQAGCDAYFGYPITPQAELLEWMARRMPELGRVFVQAESELGAINMALGAAATGARVLVSLVEPGHQPDGRGDELHGRLRAADGAHQRHARRARASAASGPSQADYFQATKGHGHGDYRVPVLAPSSIAEAVALTADAFEIAERYRTPVMHPGRRRDGPGDGAGRPGLSDAALASRRAGSSRGPPGARRGSSAPSTCRRRTWRPQPTTCRRSSPTSPSARSAGRARHLEDAESSIVAYGTAARVARTAIERAREQGLRAGIFRPITPVAVPIGRAGARPGLRADRRRRDVGRADGRGRPPGGRRPHAGLLPGRTGGMVPTPSEVVEALLAGRRGAGRTRPAIAVSDDAKADRSDGTATAAPAG